MKSRPTTYTKPLHIAVKLAYKSTGAFITWFAKNSDGLPPHIMDRFKQYKAANDQALDIIENVIDNIDEFEQDFNS
jgi:hypothetical protein